MSDNTERRGEKRLRYNWPVWFAEQFNDMLSQGQMVDICSGGASFTCYADRCPQQGQEITARFSVPRFDPDHGDSYDLENFIRKGRVCRIDEVSAFVRRIAFEFCDALPFKPGEVTDTDALIIDECMSDIVNEQTDEQVEEVVGG